MHISKTAWQSGYGSARWKSVTHLTKEERQMAKSGVRVFYESKRLSGGTHGTYWRVVKPYRDRFYPRVPTVEEITRLEG